MSTWRRKAIEAIPERRHAFQQAWSPMSLWIDIRIAFDKAIAADDMALANRIMDYARYCLDARSIDVRTAVVCAFIEHLADSNATRARLPSLMSLAEFRSLRPVMAYHTQQQVLDAIETAFAVGRR